MRTFAWSGAVQAFEGVITADRHCTVETWRPAAADRLVYAYLQTGQDDKAKSVVDKFGAPERRGRPDDDMALAAMPARYALERSDWIEAAALQIRDGAIPAARAITLFARALGATKSGKVAASAADSAELERVADDMQTRGQSDRAMRIRFHAEAARAELALDHGRRNEAIAALRDAADGEDAVVDPGATVFDPLPLRELLADALLDAGDAAGALKEYEASLQRARARLRSFWGAGRAAEAVGDVPRMKMYYGRFAALCDLVTCVRPGKLTAAKRSMAAP